MLPSSSLPVQSNDLLTYCNVLADPTAVISILLVNPSPPIVPNWHASRRHSMNSPEARIDTRAIIEIALISRATFSGKSVGELDSLDSTSEVASVGGPERTTGPGLDWGSCLGCGA